MVCHCRLKAIEQLARPVPVLLRDRGFCGCEQIVAGAMVIAQKIQDRAHVHVSIR